jgi:hypothetical protein
MFTGFRRRRNPAITRRPCSGWSECHSYRFGKLRCSRASGSENKMTTAETSHTRSNWHEGMSMPALISLRDELDEMLQCIRASRNIRTPMITCRKCGMTARAAPPHVSVRALILALGRFEIASKDKARALEKEWAIYRKHRRMTVEGNVMVEMPEICTHGDSL